MRPKYVEIILWGIILIIIIVIMMMMMMIIIIIISRKRRCIRFLIIFVQVCLHILKVVRVVTFYFHTISPINNSKNNINEQ
jgi:hypothetical protein